MGKAGEPTRERDGRGQFADGIPLDAVLAVFDRRTDLGRPLTASDVVDALDCSRRTAHNKLDELVEGDVVEARKVGARSKVFWIPIDPDSVHGSDVRSERPQRVADAARDADLPGTGNILERRRDALLAAFDYLNEHPEATRADFLRDVYPDHPAEFESPEGWWNAIQPALGRLPGVDPPKERGHIWHYLGG
jgi:hypothetical protein